MKILYGLVILGAIGLFFLLYWSDHPRLLAPPAAHGSVAYYRDHPDALGAENVKCWKLLQETQFADLDRVMASHPHCHAAYLASQQAGSDAEGQDHDA